MRGAWLLRGALVAAAALVVPVGTVAAQPADDPVRVLHLTLDSLHPSEVGPQTPTLLALQSTGTWYEQARGVMASETLPNHVAMATGTYPGRNGIPGNTGRAAAGDTTLADPDLGDPSHLQARSFVEAIESACPDLRTATVLSKAYVHRVFLGDPVDVRFPQEQFNIPGSGHAPDATTVGFIEQQVLTGPPIDYLFANLGDIDRLGHVDTTGFVGGVPVARQAGITQTDTLLGALVETLRTQDLWDSTVLVLSSDHSMDYANPADPAAYVDLAGALQDDRRTADRFFVAENGGAGLVYLHDPAAADAPEVLAAAREVLLGVPGVLEALYRRPNPRDPGADLGSVHPDWHLGGSDRTGELFVHVAPGHKVSSGLEGGASNPLPGNHGHAATRHITMLVTGGWDGLSGPRSIAPSDPGAVDPVTLDDTAALPEQAEQVDLAPTFGWLLGVPDPGVADGQPQWQGRVLGEAFVRQPPPRCAATAPTPTPTATATATEAPAAPPAPTPSATPVAGAPAAAPVTPVTGGGGRVAMGILLAAGAIALGTRRRTEA